MILKEHRTVNDTSKNCSHIENSLPKTAEDDNYNNYTYLQIPGDIYHVVLHQNKAMMLPCTSIGQSIHIHPMWLFVRRTLMLPC